MWGAWCRGGGAERERCDGEDQDCDGRVDEDLDEPCYGGPVGTAGVGRCRAGERSCFAGAPSPECRSGPAGGRDLRDGRDDDCDGRVDEGLDCRCREGAERLCEGAASGACSPGRQACVQGRWAACAGAVLPADELCDGIDDDCDGEVDEGLGGGACVLGLGRCRRSGVLLCEDGQLRCDAGPEPGPAAERCNGVDDDCDGRLDEGLDLGAACVGGRGACEADGFLRCDPDGAVVCDASLPPPRVERCDGVDDDCDGRIDEGEGSRVSCHLGTAEQAGVGLCRAGVQACVEGAPSGPGQGAVGPAAEICNGQDDDCDGVVDELPEGGCACEPGLTRSCYGGPPATEGVGRCQAGLRTCAPDGRFGICVGELGPADEQCDAIDNDCDGRVDEAVPGTGRGCTLGVGACAREGQVVCAGGMLGCDARPGAAAAEVCNGADDDCDGRVDEQLAGVGQPCVVGVGACEAPGVTRCLPARGVVCEGTPAEARPERCDGRDDDCDGLVDEGVQQACGGCEPPPPDTCNGRDDDCDGRVDEAPDPQVGMPCRVGIGACAAEGRYACGRNGLICTGRGGEPGVELCNRIDDDCDGVVDNDARCLVDGVVAARCEEGRCRFEACAPGNFDVDGQAENGCERGCVIGGVIGGEGPDAQADVLVGAGRWARTATGGAGSATVIVDPLLELSIVAEGSTWRVPVPPGGMLGWPAIVGTPRGWTVVVRHEVAGRAELWRVDVQPGGEAAPVVLGAVAPGPPAVAATPAGVTVAWLGDDAGRRVLVVSAEAEPIRRFALPGLERLPPTAGPALLAEADRAWLALPVEVDGELHIQTYSQRADRLAPAGEADAVGPIQGPLVAARRGSSALLAYVGGGALRRHAWRLEPELALGPALALREGEGVNGVTVVVTAAGFVASSAAPAVAGACQLHLVRDDGGLVGTLPMGRLDCRGLGLSEETPPLVTWLDVAGRVWRTSPGC
ncbi:MAG: MopE-related protein [bacterium]